MSEIVRSITFKGYNPSKYPNPALQWHYRILQAIALDEELPEQPEDKTLPKYSSVHKRVGPLALEWGEILDRDVPAGRVEPPKKRKAVTNGREDGPPEKKIKRERRPINAASSDKIESLYEQGNLMTVSRFRENADIQLKFDQLKEACVQLDIPVGKTKAACVEALENYFSRRK
jgi:ATP-dependent DNA helicase 2 subunit 1